MEDAKKKKKNRRQTAKEPARGKDTWIEMTDWTQEQRCAAGYCMGCEHCNDDGDERPLDKVEDL
jgi:hypothetical protein